MNKSKNRNIYLNRKMLRESCNSGSLFMSGGRWSFVSGQQCLRDFWYDGPEVDLSRMVVRVIGVRRAWTINLMNLLE